MEGGVKTGHCLCYIQTDKNNLVLTFIIEVPLFCLEKICKFVDYSVKEEVSVIRLIEKVKAVYIF